jgi:hypothetical protein
MTDEKNNDWREKYLKGFNGNMQISQKEFDQLLGKLAPKDWSEKSSKYSLENVAKTARELGIDEESFKKNVKEFLEQKAKEDIYTIIDKKALELKKMLCEAYELTSPGYNAEETFIVPGYREREEKQIQTLKLELIRDGWQGEIISVGYLNGAGLEEKIQYVVSKEKNKMSVKVLQTRPGFERSYSQTKIERIFPDERPIIKIRVKPPIFAKKEDKDKKEITFWTYDHSKLTPKEFITWYLTKKDAKDDLDVFAVEHLREGIFNDLQSLIQSVNDLKF